MFSCYFFGLWVHALFSWLFFAISTSVIDCLGRFVPEMTYYVSRATLNLAQLNSTCLYRYRIHYEVVVQHVIAQPYKPHYPTIKFVSTIFDRESI